MAGFTRVNGLNATAGTIHSESCKAFLVTVQNASNANKKEDTGEKKESSEKNESANEEEDEFNPTLAAMESEIRPKVLKTVSDLTKEYNKLIDIVNDGTKEFVFENDDIKYPFKIVTPLERDGECLTINDDGLSIEPIINDANQRFRTSLIPQTANCKSKFE